MKYAVFKFAMVVLAVTSQQTVAGYQAVADSPDGRSVAQKLRAADLDRDGRLSRSEAAVLPVLAKHFDRIDADDDGHITRAELRAARAKLQRLQEEHFDALRDLESESHEARIRILQEAETCIKAATTPEAFRQCERREQAARDALRETLKSKRETLLTETRQ